MATSTLSAIITSTLSDVTTLGGVAISGVLAIAVALLILGFFWSKLKRRAVGGRGF